LSDKARCSKQPRRDFSPQPKQRERVRGDGLSQPIYINFLSTSCRNLQVALLLVERACFRAFVLSLLRFVWLAGWMDGCTLYVTDVTTHERHPSTNKSHESYSCIPPWLLVGRARARRVRAPSAYISSTWHENGSITTRRWLQLERHPCNLSR
jgi:hypothetical protein